MLYNDIEFVVKRSTVLEKRLKQELEAQGAGLFQLAKSVENKLPTKTFKQLEKMSQMRNQVVHGGGDHRVRDRFEYLYLFKHIQKSLDKLQ